MAETFSLDFIDASDNLNLWEEIKNRLELEEEIAEIVGRSLLEKIPKGKKNKTFQSRFKLLLKSLLGGNE